MAGPRILLHTCCAVCFEAAFPALEEEGREVTAFFHNPNIHPYREFEKRLRAVEVITDSRKVPLVADKGYGLEMYLSTILPEGPNRCGMCYRVRLEAAAREAKRLGCEAFTTTLLVSKHQKHLEVKAAGEAAGAAAGVEFVYRDWRDRMESGIESAKKRSLYRQQYCGCIMSEYERFGPGCNPAGE